MVKEVGQEATPIGHTLHVHYSYRGVVITFLISFLIAILITFIGAVIATWKEKGCFTLWKVMKTLPLQNSNTVCFKTCYLIHKMLRDGYPEVHEYSVNISTITLSLNQSVIQWNFSIVDTIGTGLSVLIREVFSFQR